MKSIETAGRKRAPIWRRALWIVLAFTLACSARAQVEANAATNSGEADIAWKELQKALQPPAPPADWQLNRPTPDQVEKFHALKAGLAGLAADQARDFYTRYPDHPKAAEARKREFEVLTFAAQLGNTNRTDRLEALRAEQLKDPNLDETERLKLYMDKLRSAVMAKQADGQEAVVAEYEKHGRELMKELPAREEGYRLLLAVAQESEPDKARSIAREIASGAGPKSAKAAAEGLLRKLDLPGKPVAIKFTAVDGRDVNLGKMAGKVVLIDFWATWCGPCVAELPNVKRAYDKLHPKGFEIVGISFDQDKERLEDFVKTKDMPWPQYFDGKGWENDFGREFGISSIPTMWLVDKKGILRDVNARADLEGKVEKLLKE